MSLRICGGKDGHEAAALDRHRPGAPTVRHRFFPDCGSPPVGWGGGGGLRCGVAAAYVLSGVGGGAVSGGAEIARRRPRFASSRASTTWARLGVGGRSRRCMASPAVGVSGMARRVAADVCAAAEPLSFVFSVCPFAAWGSLFPLAGPSQVWAWPVAGEGPPPLPLKTFPLSRTCHPHL